MRACEVCGDECKPNSVRFCSVPCMAKWQEKDLDMTVLQSLVAEGATAKRICMTLGVSRTTLIRRLRLLGVYRQWTHNRFAKCREVA